MSRPAKIHQANVTPTGCRHHFNVDNHNVGTCSLCGEVRQFPFEKGGEVVVLKAGRPPANPGRPRGRPPANPARPKRDRTWTAIQEKHRYYESHKGEIMTDLLSLGRQAAQDKWGIPSSTATGLEKRWLTPTQRAILTTASFEQRLRAPLPAISANGHLPHFPQFSDSWDPAVQLKWLEVYQNLDARQTAQTNT